MKDAVKILVFIDMLFVFLLSLSGVSGAVGEIIYLLAYALPTLIGFLSAKRLRQERERVKGVREDSVIGVRLTGDDLAFSLPLVFPTVSAVIIISVLTSLIMNALGAEVGSQPEGELAWLVFRHALLPAVLEEITFRYIPVSLLAPYSKRKCLVYSSVFFALIHCNLYQMPFALAAGVILGFVAIQTGSILPSILIHFINNTASIVYARYCVSGTARIIFFSALASLTVLSVIFIIIRRRTYGSSVRNALSDKGYGTVGTYPMALAVLCVGSALFNVFWG